MAGLLAQPARVTRVAVPASSPLASPAFISPSRFSAAAHGRIAARQRKSLAVRETAAAAGDSSGDGDNVVTLLDYGAGNVRSVRNAIRLLGYEINDPNEPEYILVTRKLSFSSPPSTLLPPSFHPPSTLLPPSFHPPSTLLPPTHPFLPHLSPSHPSAPTRLFPPSSPVPSPHVSEPEGILAVRVNLLFPSSVLFPPTHPLRHSPSHIPYPLHPPVPFPPPPSPLLPSSQVSEPEDILAAKKLIFPGVGAFRAAMDVLNERGLADAIRQYVALDRPFLGICLGLQLLFDGSQEFGDGE
ncbi:unnamed protein product [Closterium sp. NIES-64]|nr:unnamed protein product [Closterium sp. NIES-64]